MDLLKIVIWSLFVLLLSGYIGYQDGHEKGYQEGITYQSQVDLSNINLGLIEIPGSGYYIVNHNYGNFKINATDQTEALKYLLNEISPCFLEEYLCQQIKN